MRWALAAIALPFLTAMGLALLRPGRIASQVELWACAGTVVAACTLPPQVGEALPGLRLDGLAALLMPLLAAGALASCWGSMTQPGWRVRHPASRQAALGGALLAALAAMPLLTWAGLVIATAAALFPARDWDRVPLAGIGLSLALFGIIAASSGPLIGIPPAGILAPTGVVLGYGILAALVPDLIILLPALLLRVLGTLAGGSAQALLLGLGSSALLACAVRLLPRTSERRRLAILPLAQAAAAVVAFGLGGAEAIFAGLVQLILLAMSIAAVAVSEGTGPSRLASVAGLAGLPPLGVFPGLVLIVLAVAHQRPWLLVPLGMALMVIGWTTITALPSGRRNGREGISAAWVPLALAVLIGWLLPAGAADWLRDIAVGLAGGLPGGLP